MENLREELARLEQQLGGTLGLYAAPVPAGEPRVHYNDREQFPAASTIKVFILLALLEQVEAGRAALDEEVVLTPSDQVTGSGVLKALTAGRLYTLQDLATLMIIISDNSATNLLIERLGVDAINEACGRHGWDGTYLVGKLENAKGLTGASFTCPRDLGDHFVRLWQGELLPSRLTAVAQGIYRRQQLTDQMGREIGYDGYSTETGRSRLVIASKSGSLRGVRNDAGIIETPAARYAVAIMTKGCPDERFHPENQGSRVVSAASRLAFQLYGSGAG